jgi:hypothetical protein
MSLASTFKPTRAELKRAQYLATECEIDAGVTVRLGRNWYGAHRPAQRSAEAFALSAKVAARAAS